MASNYFLYGASSWERVMGNLDYNRLLMWLALNRKKHIFTGYIDNRYSWADSIRPLFLLAIKYFSNNANSRL